MLFLKFLVEEILRCFTEVGQISVYIFYVLCALSPQGLIRNGNTMNFNYNLEGFFLRLPGI